MKKILILSSLMGLLLTTTSCREEFLQSEPTETLANPPAQAKLNGLYLMMVNTGTGGTTGHDDYGQKGYDLVSDMLSADMVLSGVTYGWYRNIANLTATTDFTNNANYQPWRYYYRIAYAANDVIAGLGGNDAVPASAADKAAMGQAKAMRAYAYFYLTQYFTTKYDPAAPAIPLYIDAGVQAQPKAKQSEIYAQIVKDLTEAVTLLNGFGRANKGVINQDVAKGLLAYTYAAMGENAKAAALSQSIISNFPKTNKEQTAFIGTEGNEGKGGGFNDLKTSSWMWGFDLTEANDLDLISWWGQADVFSYSYSWVGDSKAIDYDLYDAMRTDDVRRNQFATVVEFDPTFDPKNPNAASYLLNPDGTFVLNDKGEKILSSTKYPKGYVLERMYFDPTKNADDYMKVSRGSISYEAVPVNKFYAPERILGGQRIITTDYLFMRADEFHLLAAETLAKSGNEAQAKDILKNFLTDRLNSVSYIDGLSGAALLNEIYLQTRIEFWGEGKSYLAMKRNKATIKRGPNHLFYEGQTFSYDDDRLSMDIPQAEINNNPKLK
ncbi:MAG TPA: RagB/SusD family nutrient uptake outer membrane protein [Chryseobacterium sp.]|nr:RagB/SusD family nutrient uptake outer membrane protein [Chryseobacterium sp.]